MMHARVLIRRLLPFRLLSENTFLSDSIYIIPASMLLLYQVASATASRTHRLLRYCIEKVAVFVFMSYCLSTPTHTINKTKITTYVQFIMYRILQQS